MDSPRSFSAISCQLMDLMPTYCFSVLASLLLSRDSLVALFAFYSFRVKSFIGTNSKYDGFIGF